MKIEKKDGLKWAMQAIDKRKSEINVFHFDDIKKPFVIELRMSITEMINILNKYFTIPNPEPTKRTLIKKLKELKKL